MEGAFRSQDVFGGHVEFTYKGKHSYQTNIGAVVSIFVKIVMICFIVQEFYVIFTKKHPLFGIKTKVNDFSMDPEIESEAWDPRERGFDIAISVL